MTPNSYCIILLPGAHLPTHFVYSRQQNTYMPSGFVCLHALFVERLLFAVHQIVVQVPRLDFVDIHDRFAR